MFDLPITDIALPDDNGYELMEKLDRRRVPHGIELSG